MGDLTQNKPFEVEVRFSIPDINNFKKLVNDLEGELIREYSFTDYHYKPRVGDWNVAYQSVRIRQWKKPKKSTRIYITKNEIIQDAKLSFKRSLYLEGKRMLYQGELVDCQKTLADLGFEESYRINKEQGWVWKVEAHDLEFCAEKTDLLGWTGEIEVDGTNITHIQKQIDRHKRLLQLKDIQLSYKPLAVMIEEFLERK